MLINVRFYNIKHFVCGCKAKYMCNLNDHSAKKVLMYRFWIWSFDAQHHNTPCYLPNYDKPLIIGIFSFQNAARQTEMQQRGIYSDIVNYGTPEMVKPYIRLLKKELSSLIIKEY